jgi:hypothetical protein
MLDTDRTTACRGLFRSILIVTKGVAMSSSTHRIKEAVNLIRAYKGDPDADEIIRMKTGYSKAFISTLRSDMEKYDTTRMKKSKKR